MLGGFSASSKRERVSPLVVNAARHIDVADYTLVQGLNGSLDVSAGASLCTALHQAVVAPGRGNHLASLEQVVADRLLHINVLARLARPNSCQCMPVIAGGNRDGVDVVVIENAAQILLESRLFASEMLEFRAFLVQDASHPDRKTPRRRLPRCSASTRM